MLANVFKTAAELRIPEHERAALIETLYRIEDGTIPMGKIYMGQFHYCGTHHCLAGWANQVDQTAFPEVNNGTMPDICVRLDARLPRELLKIFGINYGTMSQAPPQKAVAALRSYLETGVCP